MNVVATQYLVRAEYKGDVLWLDEDGEWTTSKAEAEVFLSLGAAGMVHRGPIDDWQPTKGCDNGCVAPEHGAGCGCEHCDCDCKACLRACGDECECDCHFPKADRVDVVEAA